MSHKILCKWCDLDISWQIYLHFMKSVDDSFAANPPPSDLRINETEVWYIFRHLHKHLLGSEYFLFCSYTSCTSLILHYWNSVSTLSLVCSQERIKGRSVHARPIIWSLLLNTCSLLFLRNVPCTLRWLCCVTSVNIPLIQRLFLQMCALSRTACLRFALFLPSLSGRQLILLLLVVFCVFLENKGSHSVGRNPEFCAVSLCEIEYSCMFWQGGPLTLYFLLPSKGGSQRLTGGAEHSVGPAVAVPHAVSSVGEVLDPVSWQGKLSGVITVTGVGIPVEFTERALHHTKEAIHIAHYKLGCIHWWVPQDPRDNVISCPHTRLFVHLWWRIKHKMG